MADDSSSSGGCGVGVGAVAAFFISYHLGASFWYCVLHAFFGWFYVFYALITYPDKIF